MTLLIADIASYQGELTLEGLQAAGFQGINVKISHGLTQKSVHPRVMQYMAGARERGMEVSGFHWLDGSASGAEQARYAYTRMRGLTLDVNGCHVVDAEDPSVTERIYLDYLATMNDLLKRPVTTYTGDWFAAQRPWLRKSDHSPWLWSAPVDGYLGAYPSDASEHWRGYAGWTELAAMQYAVAAVGNVRVSMSAVRSEDTWRAMTGVPPMASWTLVPCLVSLRDEFNKLAPDRDRASDGAIGDPAHADRSSDHNPDETGSTPSEDADSKNEVHAIDVDDDLRRAGWTMQRCIDIVVSRHRDGRDNRLQNIIYNRRIWSRSWGWTARAYTGSNAHTQHGHFSSRYDTAQESDTRPWGLLAAAEKEEDIVEPADIAAIAKATVTELLGRKLVDPYDKDGDPRLVKVEDWIRYSPSRGQVDGVGNTVRANGAEIMALLAALAARPDVDNNALAAALAGPLASALAPMLPEDKEVSAATLRDAFKDLFSGEEPNEEEPEPEESAEEIAAR